MYRLSLNNTPLAAATLPFTIGIALALAEVDIWICGVVLITLVIAAIALGKQAGFVVPLFALAGFALGFINIEKCELNFDSRTQIVVQCNGEKVVRGRWQTFDGQVVSYCDSTNVWKPTTCNIKLSIDTSVSDIFAGTILQTTGKLRRIDGSYGTYVARQGFAGRFYGYNINVLGRDTSLYYRTMNGVNDYRAQIYNKIYAIDTSNISGTSIIAALTVGARGAIPSEINTSYRRAGASHLLSISGLHVGIIFAILNIVFGTLRILPRGQLIFGVLVIVALWGYTIFSGMSPATIRAAIMFTLFQVAIISSRGATSLNILLFSALVLLLFNPRYVFNVGFQLSYIAMAGITLLYGPISKLLRIKNGILRAIWNVTAISLAAQIAVAPLVALTFGQLPLVGWIVNIAVWITVPIIIVGAMLFLALGVDFIGSATLWVADIQNSIISFTASHDWVVAQIQITPLTTGILYVILTAIALTINYLQNRQMLQVGHPDYK